MNNNTNKMKRYIFLFVFLFAFCNFGISQYFRDQFIGQYTAQNKRITQLGTSFETTWHSDTFDIIAYPTDTNKIRITNLQTGWSSLSVTDLILELDSTFYDVTQTDTGLFYYQDSIYLLIQGGTTPIRYWDYFWGRKIIPTSAPTEILSNITFYPNPTTNAINVAVTESNLPVEITLYDIYGKSCKEIIINTVESKTDISDLLQGVYIVKIKSKTEIMSTKIIKE
jgi:hypothetical protein